MDGVHKIYQKRGYFAVHGTDVLVSVLIVVACVTFVTKASYDELLAAVRHDWATERCNPIYMPFAGVIMPVPGQTAWKTTSKNFDYCTQHDISSILKTAIMPLEYIAFVIIATIDLLIKAIAASMAFLASLKFKMSGLFNMTFLKISDIMVPIMVLLYRARDNLAKMNATFVTSLFTAMVVYKITVSGIINVMTIIMNLMLALIGVIGGMFILALILLFNPFTFIGGIVLMATTVVLIAVVLVPAVIIYTMMHTFMAKTFEPFGTSTPPPPEIPTKPRAPPKPKFSFPKINFPKLKPLPKPKPLPPLPKISIPKPKLPSLPKLGRRR
jgi:hypothetical protein